MPRSIQTTDAAHLCRWPIGTRLRSMLYVGGGRRKPYLDRYKRDVRYSLMLFLNATAAEIDIYTPIQIAVGIAVEIE
jgi:hypothetical protein